MNHMYVQFQVMVHANSQENKGHMRVFVPKKQRKADIGSFRANGMLKFFSNILIFKQTDNKSLEGVINHMYVQFQVMVKTKSQENRKDITAVSSTYINKGSLT